MANVTPEMIDAALRVAAWEDDGALFPDAYSDEEVAMERESMRKCLEAALNAAPQPQAIDPSWSLHDRVEFTLRDAGFDLDEASRIAALAATPQPKASAEDVGLISEVLTFTLNDGTWLRPKVREVGDAWQRIRADYERVGVVK